MLNEVSNNNYVTRIENMVDEVPNNYDTMHVANNVRLTVMGAQQFSMVAI